jgi:hypothetical protein
MRFLSVGSHLCTWASSGQSLTGLPLPSASGYPDDIGSSHRGLSPHKLMPMSGVHRGSTRPVPAGFARLHGRVNRNVRPQNVRGHIDALPLI